MTTPVPDPPGPGETKTYTGTLDAEGRWIDGPHEVAEPERYSYERPCPECNFPAGPSLTLQINQCSTCGHDEGEVEPGTVDTDRLIERFRHIVATNERMRRQRDREWLPPARLPFEDVDVRALDHSPSPVTVETCSVCGLRWWDHVLLAKTLHEQGQHDALGDRQSELGRPLTGEETRAIAVPFDPEDVVTKDICLLVQGWALDERGRRR